MTTHFLCTMYMCACGHRFRQPRRQQGRRYAWLLILHVWNSAVSPSRVCPLILHNHRLMDMGGLLTGALHSTLLALSSTVSIRAVMHHIKGVTSLIPPRVHRRRTSSTQSRVQPDHRELPIQVMTAPHGAFHNLHLSCPTQIYAEE